MNIFDAANKFLASKRRRFPIIENGKLVGQISQKDILKAALALKGAKLEVIPIECEDIQTLCLESFKAFG